MSANLAATFAKKSERDGVAPASCTIASRCYGNRRCLRAGCVPCFSTPTATGAATNARCTLAAILCLYRLYRDAAGSGSGPIQCAAIGQISKLDKMTTG
jgi:hypothetical protein